jgi:hypothetical protein
MPKICRQHAKHPYFALKIDTMKAYDRVEWGYLHEYLGKLGFSQDWITTVMRCVTNVRYAIRVNGELTSLVVDSRGIRQGEPISSYHFLLCTEGLSSLVFFKRRTWGCYKEFVMVVLAHLFHIYLHGVIQGMFRRSRIPCLCIFRGLDTK